MNTLIRTSEFFTWLEGLRDLKGRARVLARLTQAEGGNFGDCEPVGDCVS
jgi:putative addiction module killer protein